MNSSIPTHEPEASQPYQQPMKGDCWLYWPTVMALVSAFDIIILCKLPGLISFILIPSVAFASPVVVASLLFLAGACLFRNRPRKAASVLIAVFSVLVFWRPLGKAANYAHLALTVGLGIGGNGGSPAQSGNGFAVYDWSVGLAGGENTFLIYDATDEIALPLAQHRHPVASENGFGESCAGRVESLVAHYYICSF